jgi:ABC-2 type transport system permease protein
VLLAVGYGAIALLVGSITGHRARALGVTAALAVGAYVVNGLAPLVDVLEPVQKLSPFYHYAAGDPLRDGLAATHVCVLLAVAVVAGVLAPLTFEQRDLRA